MSTAINKICCLCNSFEIDPKDFPGGLNLTSNETWICQKCEKKLRQIVKLYDYLRDCDNCLKRPLCKNKDICPDITTFIKLMKHSDVVKCKDCIHRPEITDPDEAYGFCLTFPDRVCPCQNEDDPWYSWRPVDDWYCPNGERKENEKDI